MALIIQNRLLFIHVPKTGGSFIRAACKELGFKTEQLGDFSETDHFSYRQTVERFPEEVKHLYPFGYVRDPVQWLRSRWAWAMESDYLGKLERGEPGTKEHWLAKCYHPQFQTFLWNYLHRCPGMCEATFKDKLIKKTLYGNDFINVFKYEDLIQSFVRVCIENGLRADYGRLFEMKRRRVGAAGKWEAQTKVPLHFAKEIIESEQFVYKYFYGYE